MYVLLLCLIKLFSVNEIENYSDYHLFEFKNGQVLYNFALYEFIYDSIKHFVMIAPIISSKESNK